MRTVWEIWRYLGPAIAAMFLGASQIQPNPLPGWLFPLVAVLALVSTAAAYLAERRGRG